MAHITGGGLVDNIPRILPPKCSVRIDKSTWPVPKIFEVVKELGNITESEMYHVFNMGIGMVLVASKRFAPSIIKKLEQMNEDAFIIGSVIKGNRSVKIAK
jgi:phosphoribosylformylglycinamidine cyclo-ligase